MLREAESALGYLELLADRDEMNVGKSVYALELTDGDTIGLGNM